MPANQTIFSLNADKPAKPNHFLTFTQICLPTKLFPHINADAPAKQNHFLTFKQIRLQNQTVSSHLHRSACHTKTLPYTYTDLSTKPNCFLTLMQMRLPNKTISSHLHRPPNQSKPLPKNLQRSAYQTKPFSMFAQILFQTKPKCQPNQTIYFHMKAGSLAKP
jgi:hypothetical protein